MEINMVEQLVSVLEVSLGADSTAVSASADVPVVQLLVTAVEEGVTIPGAAGPRGRGRAAS